jgi:hypothetical protein
MRAQEKRDKDTKRDLALGSIVRFADYVRPGVIETFNRSPYYPVLNFDKGVVKHDGPSRWEED